MNSINNDLKKGFSVLMVKWSLCQGQNSDS